MSRSINLADVASKIYLSEIERCIWDSPVFHYSRTAVDGLTVRADQPAEKNYCPLDPHFSKLLVGPAGFAT